METEAQMSDVSREFHGVRLGDRRLDARLGRIVDTVRRAPHLSLPELFADPSQLEGAYRFIENDRVDAEAILEPHNQRTMERAARAGVVLVVHDTTTFAFEGGGREGMGTGDPSDHAGFYLHSSMCVDLEGQPLGVARTYAWHRTGTIAGKIPQSISQYNPDRESLRWNEAVHDTDDGIRAAASAAGTNVHVVHVMDREADAIELQADMMAHGRSFVMRAKADRRLQPGRKATNDKLFGSLTSEPVRVTSEVVVVRRQVHRSRPARNPERKGGRQRATRISWGETRIAQLEVRAARRTVHRGNSGHVHVPAEGLDLGVVHIQEVDAPDGVEPVCWYLLTDLAVATDADIEFVIAAYRRRWLIEELHKALKTGCTFEEHQFEHGDRYLRMLAIYLPIASQMLRMRWFDRFRADADATAVLDADQLQALRAHQFSKGKPLPEQPTASDVMRVIARLGGHLPQNGPPGWQIIGRGFATLHTLTEGWRAARAWFLAQDAPRDDEIGEDEGSPEM